MWKNIYFEQKYLICISFFVLNLFVLIFVIGKPCYAIDKDKNLLFPIGEKLTLEIKWGVIKAGTAVLEVLPEKHINGEKSRHFALNVKTSSLVNCFFKIRDKFEAYTDLDVTRSILYRQKADGTKKKDVVVNFDWDKKQARYSNFGNKREPIDIYSGSYDPLSAFYGMRIHDFNGKTEIVFPITDGKKSFIGKAKIVRKEIIKLNGTTYDTYLIEPELVHFDGVFKKSKDPELKIWITADERKLLVKIKCKVIVGSLVGKLVSANLN